jgi:3-hydroxyisobutyrate dehydrogenase
MASGAKAHYDKVKPILDAMGTKVFHVGERPGQGNSMKAMNQILCGVHLVAAAEALSFAKATGIDPALALEIVKGSAAGSWMLSNRAHRMLEEEPTCYSSVQTWAKDFGIIMDSSKQVGAHLPLSAIAGQMWNSAMGRGQAVLDDTTVSGSRYQQRNSRLLTEFADFTYHSRSFDSTTFSTGTI